VPGIFLALPAASSADRCHSLKSLLPPQAALLSLPLCTPSGANREMSNDRYSLYLPDAALSIHSCNSPQKKTISGPMTGAGWGSGGGRLKTGLIMRDDLRSNERLCGQRIPQPLSLVHFLCGHKK